MSQNYVWCSRSNAGSSSRLTEVSSGSVGIVFDDSDGERDDSHGGMVGAAVVDGADVSKAQTVKGTTRPAIYRKRKLLPAK